MADAQVLWCRVLLGTVLSLRRFPGDLVLRDTMAAHGLSWPDQPNGLAGSGPWLAWRSPTETWLLAAEVTAVDALSIQFAPGEHPSAVAFDIRDAVVCIEAQGKGIKHLLPRLVDASALPTQPGCVARCRLGEVAVMLMRIEEQRLWLVVERSVADHAEAWLAYASESA